MSGSNRSRRRIVVRTQPSVAPPPPEAPEKPNMWLGLLALIPVGLGLVIVSVARIAWFVLRALFVCLGALMQLSMIVWFLVLAAFLIYLIAG